MKYQTKNELEHFLFQESYLSEIRMGSGTFYAVLDHVTIQPENSCNRDIRQMRTNQLHLTIEGAEIKAFVKEGYQVYDANGKLLRREPDVPVAPEEYREAFEDLQGAEIYSIEKKDDVYVFSINTEEQTVLLEVTGVSDVEAWDRFMNLESTF